MNETLVEHISDEEMVITSRPAPVPEDVLTSLPRSPALVYPVIEAWATGHANGYLGHPQPTPHQRVWHRLPGCSFHDFCSSTDQELAGMGLAIIGNVCRMVASKALSTTADAKLLLKLIPGSEDLALPWPGMPDDRSRLLDLAQLPFEFEMFLHDETHQFQKRVSRLDLMRRIEAVWVPHLKGLLQVRL